MKTIYLDLGMGAAGDMLTAAVYELLCDNEKKTFIDTMNNAGIPGVLFKAESVQKCGITGTHMSVSVHGQEETSIDIDFSEEVAEEHEHHHHEHTHEHNHEEHSHEEGHHHEHSHEHHHHTSMNDITATINSLKLPDEVKANAVEVYNLIAQAESNAHGKPVTEIHFHEVGTMDAVADVTAFCYLMHMMGSVKLYASAVHVGSGHVHCAHGILPVPAPATAFILKGIPIYGGDIRGELCTPTGAALLKHFVQSFGKMPGLIPEKYGYGMGKKDFKAANCVRAILGQTEENTETIYEYTCNVDDMSGEQIAFAVEQLFAAGAVDAYTIHCGMKKSRPGILLFAVCREQDRQKIIQTIFKHTSTLGMRETVSNRYYLDRTIKTVSTKFGDMRVKKAEGFGITKQKYEYEDLAAAARDNDLSIRDVLSQLNEEK